MISGFRVELAGGDKCSGCEKAYGIKDLTAQTCPNLDSHLSRFRTKIRR